LTVVEPIGANQFAVAIGLAQSSVTAILTAPKYYTIQS
jgi:hypothetical protein